MNKIKDKKELNEEEETYLFLTNLHSFLKEKLREAKDMMEINLKIELNDESIIYERKRENFNLHLSPSIANIIEKFDKRVKYLCDSEEKLINIHNLLKIDLNKIQLDKEYDINFNL